MNNFSLNIEHSYQVFWPCLLTKGDLPTMTRLSGFESIGASSNHVTNPISEK